MGGSAHWIVRDFAQIDGDILRTKKSSDRVIYHFATLSDEDMTQSRIREFPWPLDEDFFVLAQEPVDWKYQVYVRARKEKANYNRYALVFGLQFNRNDFMLSYVKHKDDRERAPYYLLNALGAKPVKYNLQKIKAFVPNVSDLETTGAASVEFGQRDLERYRICPYRFLLESIMESGTIYKDTFLQARYLEILLESDVRVNLVGLPRSEQLVEQTVNSSFEEWRQFFPFVGTSVELDVKRKVRKRLMEGKGAMFPAVDEAFLQRKEIFLFLQLENKRRHNRNIMNGVFSDESQDTINKHLGVDPLHGKAFIKRINTWCKYCSNREICVPVEGDLE